MPRSDLKSDQTELVVLSVLAAEPLYGYAIGKRVAEMSAGALKLGPSRLYPLLSKLEQSKLVTTSWEEVKAANADAGSDGRRRKWYRLTAKGTQRLAQRIEQHRRQMSLIERFIETAGPDAVSVEGAAS
ncbi:MAG: PadR family transcriptional regulator [Planctomycetota bacterium]